MVGTGNVRLRNSMRALTQIHVAIYGIDVPFITLCMDTLSSVNIVCTYDVRSDMSDGSCIQVIVHTAWTTLVLSMYCTVVLA